MNWTTRRRFWTTVAPVPSEDGWTVVLDARPLRTPAKAPLILPSAPLAEAIAAEWDSQREEIRPQDMPLTRAANSAIDKVRPARAAVVTMLAEYGGSDLLCYRADGPEGLVARQCERWDRWIGWAEAELSAPLTLVQGVMHCEQPEASLSRLQDAVAAHDAFELAALHDLVTLSGSLVLGLAVSRGVLDPQEAWRLSRLDEDWQAELWGEDAEAARAAAEREAAFLSAKMFLDLVRATD
ncbi:ATPase [Halovulum dunhuangense]|uniref:ATPase n=1 Tax=Halovulum dunhuangense TaxID=1505036 RepID=A0A849L0L2_9RHOB|nr:ATP12 family protein [Halovulum dunhuangense]NNU79808.1 ATPase [Halovulum dunhuangense]